MAKKPSKKVEAPLEDIAPEKIEKPLPVKAKVKPDTVSVKNLTKTWFRQPATGIRLDQNETKPMANDGWLHSQVDAGFLEIQ